MWTNDAANVSQDFDWHLQTSSAAKKNVTEAKDQIRLLRAAGQHENVI